MKDQQIFFKAVADQMAKTDVTKMIRVINAVVPYIQTDMSLMQMIKSAVALKDAGSANMYTATIGGEWKSPYIYTDVAMKKKLLGDFKAGRSFEPTPSLRPRVPRQPPRSPPLPGREEACGNQGHNTKRRGYLGHR